MSDIFHDFMIKAPAGRVYSAITGAEGLDSWWTKKSAGRPRVGEAYTLWFGPEYDWKGVVRSCEKDRCVEWEITADDADWAGTRVGFELEEKDGQTQVRFYHKGWKSANEHYRISMYCWAMYLRLLKRYVEYGEFVPYEERLEV